MDFTEQVDLASERLGGGVLLANDDFFAPKENLLKDSAPAFVPGKYTDRGKWMDGWETRCRRTPDFEFGAGKGQYLMSEDPVCPFGEWRERADHGSWMHLKNLLQDAMNLLGKSSRVIELAMARNADDEAWRHEEKKDLTTDEH